MFFHKNIYPGYSLESPRHSNEYLQICFYKELTKIILQSSKTLICSTEIRDNFPYFFEEKCCGYAIGIFMERLSNEYKLSVSKGQITDINLMLSLSSVDIWNYDKIDKLKYFTLKCSLHLSISDRL